MFLKRDPVGWPSPADDYSEDFISLNQHLIKNPAATYLMRIDSNSMIGIGINIKSILIVDRSLKPKNNNIVIALVDGSYICRQLKLFPKLELISRGVVNKPITIDKEEELEIIGVVIAAINQY